jgi:predicted AAA+ superfamily ATPase
MVHNTALISAQRYESYDEIVMKPEQWGRVVESAIGAYLLNGSFSRGYSVYYWRNGNDKVDFVLENRGRTVAIEVKTSNADYTKGMLAFKKTYQPDRILLVGKGGLPWQDFLKIDPVSLF